MKMIRTYSELIKLSSFEERFEYLKIGGEVGDITFGFDRYLNQIFYKSQEWKSIRSYVILRDNGNDLALEDFPIFGKIIVHHMNPVSLNDIYEKKDEILDPEFLISVSHNTHNAIHYGDIEICKKEIVIRNKNDTIPWK